MTEETNLSNTRDTLQWKDLLTKTVATETVLAMETVVEEAATLTVAEEAATEIVRVTDVPRAATEDTLISIPIAKEALRIEEATDVRKVPENVVISMLEIVVLSDILPSITDSTTTLTTGAMLGIEKVDRPIREGEAEPALAADTAITGLVVSVADVPADTVADMAPVLIVADLPARLLR